MIINSKILKILCLSITCMILSCFGMGISCVMAKEIKKQRVVDPAKIPFSEMKGKEAEMAETNKLTDKEGKYLLSVARKTIEQKLFGGKGEGKDEVLHESTVSWRKAARTSRRSSRISRAERS